MTKVITNLTPGAAAATTTVVAGEGATRDASDCGCGATTISIFMARSVLMIRKMQCRKLCEMEGKAETLVSRLFSEVRKREAK